RRPGAGARHRHSLGCAGRLRRGGGRADAPRLARGRADALAATPARGDGRWRARGDLGARESVPLSAWTVRARQPDRALPQDEEAEIEAARARREGRVLQAAAVPGRLGGAVPGTARVGAALK